jgi:mono/diheme cytochrome c family protein
MKPVIASVGLIPSVLLIGLGISAAQAQQAPPTVKRVPVHATQTVSGKDLYQEYCAVCHGTTGKGDGPAAGALKTPLSDLTQISKKNGGKFPEVHVQQIINGEAEGPVAHGSKDMPIWGSLFRHMGPNPDIGGLRIHNLMKYIEEIQGK